MPHNSLCLYQLGTTEKNPFIFILVNTCLKNMQNLTQSLVTIVDSPNTDLNSAWIAMGLRSVFDESTIF